jgi:8-oxo-dGTP pyrophosphatase MutT (NUDIX family)
MHRQALLRLLNDYRHRHPDEAWVVRRFRTFVESHPDCFERQLAVGHVTGSAWLVNRAGTHVLLTHHRKLDRWIQLGGHADGNPDPLAVALEEAREESGLPAVAVVWEDVFDIAIHDIPAIGDEPAHQHYDVRYAVRATDSERYRVGNESHDLAWVEIERLGDYTREKSMLRLARKWLKVRGC